MGTTLSVEGQSCSQLDTKPMTLDITILAGGPSSEREVSINSGKAVCEALTRLGHKVVVRDIGPDDLSALDEPADFVFIALHGEFGEDGTVQAELERRGISYCGSGEEASRLAMDKVDAKMRFERADIPTPGWMTVQRGNTAEVDWSRHIPAVVKPVASGSSVDTTIQRDESSLKTAAEEVAQRYGAALIEQYISGPELTVGILGDRALPVCQIVPAREFYDYHAKYVADDTEYRFDVPLPSELLARIQKLSLEAHRVLGCEVFSRVDWLVDGDTLQPYVLEVNTIPGFTSHSLLPKSAERVGIGFDELCERIITLSSKGDDGRAS